MLRQIHLLPGQAFHLVRADAGKEHDAYRRRTAAALVVLRRGGKSVNFLRGENLHRLFLHPRRIYPRHRIRIAPPALHRRGEHPAQNQPRLLPLPRRIESLLHIRRAFLRGDAPHPPLRQPRTAFEEAPREVSEIVKRPLPPVLPRFQCFLHRLFKGHGFLLLPQSGFPRCQTFPHPIHSPMVHLQRLLHQNRCFQHIHPGTLQHRYRCSFFLVHVSCAFVIRKSSRITLICKQLRSTGNFMPSPGDTEIRTPPIFI